MLLFLAACSPQERHPAPAPGPVPGRLTKLTAAEIQNLKPLNVDYQLRGWCYAYSSPGNGRPSNGEYQSDNLPKEVTKDFPRAGFYLALNAAETIALDDSMLGCKLFLVNTTDSSVTLEASDSRLSIIVEAQDKTGAWRPISYLPASDCGNSYHDVVLDSNEYWEFDVPVFGGSFQTKLRYSLMVDERTTIRSNEMAAGVNASQFLKNRREGHVPANVMDPYEE